MSVTPLKGRAFRSAAEISYKRQSGETNHMSVERLKIAARIAIQRGYPKDAVLFSNAAAVIRATDVYVKGEDKHRNPIDPTIAYYNLLHALADFNKETS